MVNGRIILKWYTFDNSYSKPFKKERKIIFFFFAFKRIKFIEWMNECAICKIVKFVNFRHVNGQFKNIERKKNDWNVTKEMTMKKKTFSVIWNNFCESFKWMVKTRQEHKTNYETELGTRIFCATNKKIGCCVWLTFSYFFFFIKYEIGREESEKETKNIRRFVVNVMLELPKCNHATHTKLNEMKNGKNINETGNWYKYIKIILAVPLFFVCVVYMCVSLSSTRLQRRLYFQKCDSQEGNHLTVMFSTFYFFVFFFFKIVFILNFAIMWCSPFKVNGI